MDRATFERVLFLLRSSCANVEYLTNNHIFVESTADYLETKDNPESRKAQTLLSIWIQAWPDAVNELADSLDEALQLVKFILAASAGGGNG
ncbi:hypothetical protein QUA03_27370 [Microcoleus sp. S36b_A4]|uniref:hypothetical protein n=1 Tax=Microcoleus sp. S36b_A4 TaxID=3055420 RepID=UPI002FCF1488